MNDNNDPNRPESAEINRVVGGRIRKAFADADIGDDIAAEMLGQSTEVLKEMFDGRIRCAPLALLLIAEATNKSVAWFFGGESTAK